MIFSCRNRAITLADNRVRSNVMSIDEIVDEIGTRAIRQAKDAGVTLDRDDIDWIAETVLAAVIPKEEPA